MLDVYNQPIGTDRCRQTQYSWIQQYFIRLDLFISYGLLLMQDEELKLCGALEAFLLQQ